MYHDYPERRNLRWYSRTLSIRIPFIHTYIYLCAYMCDGIYVSYSYIPAGMNICMHACVCVCVYDKETDRQVDR